MLQKTIETKRLVLEFIKKKYFQNMKEQNEWLYVMDIKNMVTLSSIVFFCLNGRNNLLFT